MELRDTGQMTAFHLLWRISRAILALPPPCSTTKGQRAQNHPSLRGTPRRTAASQLMCLSNLALVPISVTTMSAISGCATILAPRSSAKSLNTPTCCGVNLMLMMLILIPLNIPDCCGARAISNEDDDELLEDDTVLFRGMSPGILTLELEGITRAEPESRRSTEPLSWLTSEIKAVR